MKGNIREGRRSVWEISEREIEHKIIYANVPIIQILYGLIHLGNIKNSERE